MNKHKHPSPPRWAQRFLEWYCRPEVLEDLQGDLNEYFERNLKAGSSLSAKFIYVLDVFKFFRSYTVRKPEFINLLIQWIMIGSYIKTSGRTIVRHKLFSAINIIGLAISMSVGLLVIAFVNDLLSYDNFHEKKESIYRVITTDRWNERSMNLATTSVLAGKKIRESLPGIEKVALLRRGFGGDASTEKKIIPLSGLWADESFFDLFSFRLLSGNAATALKDPYAVVLTETSAEKLFGNEEALGKSFKIDTLNYVVTGVIEDIPKLSHMRFDALVSFSTVELHSPDFDGGFMSWENVFSNYTYLLLPEKTNPETVQQGLNKLSEEQNTGIQNRTISLSLQPLQEITLNANLGNPIGPAINKIALWVLGGLSVIVILSACFNYTNLSIARSLRRSREVGIRKVIGAHKSHVLWQFIAESLMISMMALVISFLVYLLLRSEFLMLSDHLSDLLSLELSAKLVIWFVVFAIVVGLAAGIVPALFFSRMQAIQVLKDASSLKLFRHMTLRKGLIVVQYFFSLVFITTTIIGLNQYKSFLTFDLGFTTENILNIKLQGNKSSLLKKELSELPDVKEISVSRLITSLGSMYGFDVKYKDPNDSIRVWANFIDEHYLPLHKHKFLAGRNLNVIPHGAEESEVIVNEQLIKQLNIGQGNAIQALGEQISATGQKLTIVGVLKDFHYGTLEDKIEPVVFRYSSNEPHGYINAKISSSDLSATLTGIERAWKKIDNIHPLEASFYDDQIEQAYNMFSVMVKVISFLAFLAVCIASMGLLGMVVFTTETRLKEISIRKVLGAGEGKLIYLLSKGFLLLLAIAAFLALPATYFLFDKVVLVNFPYHQPVSWLELFSGLAIVMVIAFLMIGSQTLKVARTNPAEVLKAE